MAAKTGVPYVARNGVWVPADGSASVDPASPSQIIVNAAPTGPATPSDGWQVVAADAFSSKYPLSALWYPQRNNSTGGQPMSGFNSNEVQNFYTSQVSITSDGCVLTAVCQSATKSSSSYKSGVITSQINNGPATGFMWVPTVGQIMVHEAVVKMPAMNGSDLGWWGDYLSGSDKQEIDLFEQFNFGNNIDMSCCAWFGTSGGTSYNQTLEYYVNDVAGLDPMHDGKSHRWTVKLDGTNKTGAIYVDGNLITCRDPNNNFVKAQSTFTWPSTWISIGWEYVMFSYALRDVGSGTKPPYVVGQGDTAVIRSYACYLNGSADKSKSTQGGLIAPGTTVV